MEVNKMERQECCLLHGSKHRAQFQCVVNFLRSSIQTKRTPGLNFSKVGPMICCCQKEKYESCADAATKDAKSAHKRNQIEDLLPESELEKAMDSVLLMENIPEKVRKIMSNWVKRNPESPEHVRYGNSRIAGLILLSLQDKQTLLFKDPIPDGKAEHDLTVPVPSRHLGRFFGRKGKHIKGLCAMYQFQVNVVKEAPWATKTKLKVTCKPSHFEGASKVLVARAEAVNKQRKGSADPFRWMDYSPYNYDSEEEDYYSYHYEEDDYLGYESY